MAAIHPSQYRLCLDVRERDQLAELVHEALVGAHAEARRTDAQDYKDRLHEQQNFLTQLSNKIADLRPMDEELVDFESEQSFPASDPPGWTR